MDEVNKAGGINGRKVELIVEDEKDSPAAAVNAVKKLIERGQGGGHRRPHDLRRHDGRGQNRQ